ncbi:MAG: DUF2304 domain-containing protein [Eisenbergiella sp.]
MLPVNLRITLGIALVVYFALILLFLKNKAIELKYTLLWLLAGLCMALLVIFPSILPAFLRILGITGNMNGLFIICIAFLMILCMALTSIVSRQAGKIRQLTQSIAILEKELREAEKDGREIKNV